MAIVTSSIVLACLNDSNIVIGDGHTSACRKGCRTQVCGADSRSVWRAQTLPFRYLLKDNVVGCRCNGREYGVPALALGGGETEAYLR